MRNIIRLIPVLSGLLLLFACSQQYPGYQRSKDGLYYRFHETHPENPLPQPGDFLKLKMAYYLNDSLLYNSLDQGEYPRVQLKKPDFQGDILSGLAMMREGDSASFIVRADSTMHYMFDREVLGKPILPKDKMRFEIRLEQIQTKEAFQEELSELYARLGEQAHEALSSYVAENQVDAKPSANGVYHWTTKKGAGNKPVAGDQVEVSYVGRFLNGMVFDSVYRSDSLFRFVVGKGFVIPGWEELLPQMRVGERITALIPYEMAYGDHSMGVIPPYSNLVYDIELHGITKKEEVERRIAERKKLLKAQSEQLFLDYLEAHSVTVTPLPSGLYVIPEKKGNGQHAGVGMRARIKYEGRTLDGELLGLSESPWQEVVLGNGSLMPGVEEGLLTMSEGDSATFLLPYHLAYGESGIGQIAPYTNVVLGVLLLELLPEK